VALIFLQPVLTSKMSLDFESKWHRRACGASIGGAGAGKEKGAAEASALKESGPNAKRERPQFLDDQPDSETLQTG
jgi:hypothetical protein